MTSKSILVDTHLERHTPGAVGLDFLEPDPEHLKPSAPINGRLIAKGLELAIQKAGIPPRVGDRFQVIADDNGDITKVLLREQELNIN
ncbi:MAG: hypothetical protein KBC48_00325 [Candidatus Pacebacteria bacterium]|nr:hypothetical protein [Candidatus Paceibacterota bacterium]